jgi:exonuclease VII small subunit
MLKDSINKKESEINSLNSKIENLETMIFNINRKVEYYETSLALYNQQEGVNPNVFIYKF